MAFISRRRKSKIELATRIHSKSWAMHQRKRRSKSLNSRMQKLRVEMEDITVEQEIIKEGQRQVREKFEAIEKECDQLRSETNLIVQQSVSTQIRLALMFGILKARENHDFPKASQLTSALRELVTRKKL